MVAKLAAIRSKLPSPRRSCPDCRFCQRAKMPTNKLLVQSAIILVLVLLGTLMCSGFKTVVDYTTPVFWFFFLTTGVSLFVLSMREPAVAHP